MTRVILKLFLTLSLLLCLAILTACASQTVALTDKSSTSPLSTSFPTIPPPSASATIALIPSQTPAPVLLPEYPSPTPDLTFYLRDAWKSDSPDGKWSARVVVSLPIKSDGSVFAEKYHTLVLLVDLEAGEKQVLVDRWLNYGLGWNTPIVLGWDTDRAYIYLADTGVPDGCGPAFTENIRRVDLRSGETSPLEGRVGRSPSLSPNGKTLLSFGEEGVLLHDLQRELSATLALEDPHKSWWPQTTLWSPAGDQALVTLQSNPCDPAADIATNAYLVNLPGESMQPLFSEDTRQLTPISWPAADWILFSVSDESSGYLYLQSGQLQAEPPEEVAEAISALEGYFQALSEERYDDAPQYFGGSYADLTAANPDLDPLDYPALWSNACQFNGFQCLPLRSLHWQAHPSADQFSFLVTFDQDGQAFVLGPCCGAKLVDMPPQAEFSYTVYRSPEGNYKVNELPVNIP